MVPIFLFAFQSVKYVSKTRTRVSLLGSYVTVTHCDQTNQEIELYDSDVFEDEHVGIIGR